MAFNCLCLPLFPEEDFRRELYVSMYVESIILYLYPAFIHQQSPQKAPPPPVPPQEEPKDKPPEDKVDPPSATTLVAEAQQLVGWALKGALTVALQQRLLAILDATPDIVYDIGISPPQVIFFFTLGISVFENIVKINSNFL